MTVQWYYVVRAIRLDNGLQALLISDLHQLESIPPDDSIGPSETTSMDEGSSDEDEENEHEDEDDDDDEDSEMESDEADSTGEMSHTRDSVALLKEKNNKLMKKGNVKMVGVLEKTMIVFPAIVLQFIIICMLYNMYGCNCM